MAILLKNATLFDGEKDVSRMAHIIVEGEQIVDVLNSIPENFDGEQIDLFGKCLAPGFIDTHSHNDFYAVLPQADRYCRSFVMQGITTMIGGQCGFSTLGIGKQTEANDDIFAFFAKNKNLQNVTTFEGFSKEVDNHSPVNIVCLCGHGTLRTAMLGLGDKPLTEDNFKQLEQTIDKELSSGAAGLSFGLMYNPSMYAKSDEIARLAKVVEKHGKIVTYHTRANSKVSMAYPELFGRPHNLRAIDEVVEITKQVGVKTNISHMIYVGRNTWSTLDESIKLLDDANNSGTDISFDIYPFDFGASTINVIMPLWYQKATNKQKKSLLSNIRLNIEIFATKKLLGFGFEDIEISWAGNEYSHYHGKRISDISKELGLGQLKTYLKISEQCPTDTTVIMYSYMNEHIINTLSRHDKVNYMTDAWICDNGIQNPACFSAFPKFLSLSREGKAEELGKMICKMTGLAATRYNIEKRGFIKPGYFADLVVFDKNTVDQGDHPEAAPKGITHVMINGDFAVKDGVYHSKNLGKGLAIK